MQCQSVGCEYILEPLKFLPALMATFPYLAVRNFDSKNIKRKSGVSKELENGCTKIDLLNLGVGGHLTFLKGGRNVIW